MTTVREVLIETYGDDYREGNTTALAFRGHGMSHVFTLDSRHVIHRIRDERGFDSYESEDIECIVLNHTIGTDVYNYPDTVGIANYRVLRDEWAHLAGLTDGPYSSSSHIALDLDCTAPDDLIDVIDALADYPVLSDDEHSIVEQETIMDHWNEYGRADALDALAEAIGGDPSLSTYAGDVFDLLTFSGVLDVWPEFIDPSAVEFHTDYIVAWIMRRWSVTVTLNQYGREHVLKLTRKALVF